LLVLVSRNAPEDVWRVFDEHPEMRLRREDITAARINWQPKSQNLRELAAELNLGLDAFVFFDDDLVNRAEVSAHAPGVTVVPLPAQPAHYCQTLSRLWRFDNPHVTSEDRARAEMMGAERQRQQVRDCTTNLETYLHSLQLRVEMRLATEHDLPRISQLTQKTNQFNLSLKRRSIPEVKALGAGYKIYAIEAADRFGDYGMIGACILAHDPAQPAIPVLDTFLLSCRVLGRGVEDAVLHGLCLEVGATGGTRLRAPFVTGPRNQPCRDFCDRAGFTERTPGEYEIDVVQGYTLPDHIEWLRPTLKSQNRVA
jgi:FkbH-like protein